MSSYDVSTYQEDGIRYVLTTEDEQLLVDESVDEELAMDSIDAIAGYNIDAQEGDVLFHSGENGELTYLQNVAANKDAVAIGPRGGLIDSEFSPRDVIHIGEELNHPDATYNHLRQRAVNAARKRDE